MQERTRELAATGQRDLPPGSPGAPPSALALTTQGHRMAQRRRQRGGRPVSPERGDDQGSPSRERRPDPGRGRLPIGARRATKTTAVDGSARAQRRSRAGRDAAAAEPRLQRPPHRGCDDHREASSAPNVDGKIQVTDGGFQTYKYQSLIADVDYAGNRDHARRYAAAGARRVDHRAWHGADERRSRRQRAATSPERPTMPLTSACRRRR